MSRPLRLNIISPLNALFIALCLALAASLSSCQKDLTYGNLSGETKIDIAFEGAQRATMSTWLFSPSGGQLFYSLPTNRTTAVDAPSPQFSAFCYNDDSDINRFEIVSWDDATVTTGATDLLSRSSFGGTLSEIPRGGDPDEPVLYQPTPLHADTCSMCQGKVLTLRPKSVLTEFTITIREIENIDGLQTASAALSGMASSMSLSRLQPQGTSCTIPIELTLSKGNELKGTALSFGHCSDEARKHVLTVYAIMVNGKKVYYNIDVTEQIHSTSSKQIIITISGIKLPEVSNSNVGLGLDAWDKIEDTINF